MRSVKFQLKFTCLPIWDGIFSGIVFNNHQKKLHMRRIPQQARGHARVTRILEAAADVFAEEGYDIATTNMIAERANTSVGSVYQFFPNKQAILASLTTNYQGELNARLENALVDPTSLPIDMLCNNLIDAVNDFYSGNRGFQPIYRAACSKALSDASDQLTQLLVQRLEPRFNGDTSDEKTQQRAFTALLVATICQAIIPLAAKVEPGQQARVIAELKRMVSAYLSTVSDEQQ
jgi:AcrR family transcriptional regulator